jgi:hypothetical protein
VVIAFVVVLCRYTNSNTEAHFFPAPRACLLGTSILAFNTSANVVAVAEGEVKRDEERGEANDLLSNGCEREHLTALLY